MIFYHNSWCFFLFFFLSLSPHGCCWPSPSWGDASGRSTCCSTGGRSSSPGDGEGESWYLYDDYDDMAVEVPLLVINNLTMAMIDTSYIWYHISIMNHDNYMMIMMIYDTYMMIESTPTCIVALSSSSHFFSCSCKPCTWTKLFWPCRSI